MSLTLERVEMNIPCQAEYVGIVRLTASGIATRLEFTVEEIEDIKIAISEACTNAVQYAYANPETGKIHIVFEKQPDKLSIFVSDTGKGFDVQRALNNPETIEDDPEKLGMGLGLTFIKKLMDEAEIKSETGKGTHIRMVKYLPTRG